MFFCCGLQNHNEQLLHNIESHDAKSARALSGFDVTSWPKYAWAKNLSTSRFSLRSQVIYGDSTGSPTDTNMNGKPYRSYDEAGMVETELYDFKGNLLRKQRFVIDSAVLKTELDFYKTFIVDWTGLPSILGPKFITDMAYDALNRITTMTLPEDVAGARKDIVPTYNKAGGLQTVSYDGTVYVENIIYDAKGQRLLIAFGNGVMTRYVYDNLTFRLLRQRSEKYTKNTVGNTITYDYNSGSNKQDDGFNYDLIGNIMKILSRVTDCGINGSALGDDALDRDFEYDPIYRLTYANGRESDTQDGNNYLYDDAPAPGSPNANHVRAYDRTYAYDKLGNIKDVIQSGITGFTRHYVYNANHNTLQKIEDATPTTIEDYTYDANGNQLSAGSTRNYVWNHSDQLICYYNQAGSGDPTIYTQYDYSGQDRVSKLVRTGTLASPVYERTIYIDGIFEYVKLENGSTYEKNYIRMVDDKSNIAEIRVNNGAAFPVDIADDVVYNLEDQIGSSTIRLDVNGTEIDKEEYYPFGDSSLRTFTYKRYRYVGKERDAESGLYYYGARYYAAWTCRFISVDPLGSKYPFMGSYVFAADNPIKLIDIGGKGPFPDFFAPLLLSMKIHSLVAQKMNLTLGVSVSAKGAAGIAGILGIEWKGAYQITADPLGNIAFNGTVGEFVSIGTVGLKNNKGVENGNWYEGETAGVGASFDIYNVKHVQQLSGKGYNFDLDISYFAKVDLTVNFTDQYKANGGSVAGGFAFPGLGFGMVETKTKTIAFGLKDIENINVNLTKVADKVVNSPGYENISWSSVNETNKDGLITNYFIVIGDNKMTGGKSQVLAKYENFTLKKIDENYTETTNVVQEKPK